MTHTKLIAAITDTWRAVAPSGSEDNLHPLIQKEIGLPDGMGASLIYPALVYYAEATDLASGSPDGRRGATTTRFILEFRSSDYEEAWDLAEAFRRQLGGLPAGLGTIGWGYESDAHNIDLATASGLVPRKVAVVEFTK